MYSAWGDYAKQAQSQGWFPETSYDHFTVYKSPYGTAFNKVMLGGGKYGNIALIGDNNSKTFDIVIRDSDNQPVHTIYKGISPKDAQTYLTNANSIIAQRNNSIIQGTNIDRADAQGNYVSK
jgi:hypothetical protein